MTILNFIIECWKKAIIITCYGQAYNKEMNKYVRYIKENP